MANSIKDKIDLLVKLQKIETETSDIKSMLSNVAQRFDSLDAELKTFERSIDDEASLISVIQKKYREYDSEVQMNLARIKKSKEKLHSIKNNKEYLSLLKEIEDKEAINSNIEDEMLEYLDRVDALESSTAAKKSEYLVVADQIKNDKEDIEKETEKGRKRITVLENSWKEITGKIESKLLAKFNLIKEQHDGGIAIVPVKEAVCNGCNVNLPLEMYNELQRVDSLRFCPNCQRIVYWKNG